MACPAAIPNETLPHPWGSFEALLGDRVLPRVPISFPVRIHLEGHAIPCDVRARDLSVAGIGIESPQSVALDEIRRVTLSTPMGRIDLIAEGCWQLNSPVRDRFTAGIRFIGVESIALGQLWDLVHQQARLLMRWFAQVLEFQSFSLNDRGDLTQLTRIRELRRGDTLHHQGILSPGDDSIFIVTDGEAAIETRTENGGRIVVGHAGPGDLLGGLALVTNAPTNENAIALRDTSLLEIPSAAFEKLKHANPALALATAASVMRAQLARRANPFPIHSEGVTR
jgi:hypothetical protein